jgi:YEATS domain-containing protein 4
MASVEEKADDAQPQPQAESSQPAATQESSESQSKLVDPPPVVHSWAYEEIVFPEPLEPFYDILIAHPPTP